MYEVDGIVYASAPSETIEVSEVTPLEDLMMLVTFTSVETRLFDATVLLDAPAFAALRDEQVFMHPAVVDGICTWDDEAVDVAPEFMYRHGYAYERIA